MDLTCDKNKSTIMAYLLTWKLLICYFNGSIDAEHRPRYSAFLSTSGHLKRLLNFVFKLLSLTDRRQCAATGFENRKSKYWNILQFGNDVNSTSMIVKKSFFDAEPHFSAESKYHLHNMSIREERRSRPGRSGCF